MTWRWWLNWWLEKGCLHVNWILAFYGVFLFGMAQIFPLLVVKESYRGVWSHKWRVPIKLPSEIPKWQRCLAPQQDTPMPLWKPQTFKYLVCEVSSSCCLQIFFWVVHTNTWLEIWHISSVNIQQHVKRSSLFLNCSIGSVPPGGGGCAFAEQVVPTEQFIILLS